MAPPPPPLQAADVGPAPSSGMGKPGPWGLTCRCEDEARSASSPWCPVGLTAQEARTALTVSRKPPGALVAHASVCVAG